LKQTKQNKTNDYEIFENTFTVCATALLYFYSQTMNIASHD